jgi:outer membrane receptor protein involved in Fe transport
MGMGRDRKTSCPYAMALGGDNMASEKWFRTSALASLSVFVTAAAPAVAADQIGSVGIEDIVVTARRTEENIQTTPVAVTALSTEMIKQAEDQRAIGTPFVG